MKRVLIVLGTRPEAIKMAPLIRELQKNEFPLECSICVTAQHRQMLDQVLSLYDIQPQYDLDLMRPGQELCELTSNIIVHLQPILVEAKPDIVLVHGDTTTSMAAALMSFYQHVSVGHIEAGLRTHNKYAPFPEEINRKITGALADYHFAPTEIARGNLLSEGVSADRIFVTGNTVIDGLLMMVGKLNADPMARAALERQFAFLDPSKRMILVTGHRRENFGDGFKQICLGLRDLAERHADLEIVYPVHLNPQVQDPVRQILGRSTSTNIHLIEPVDYLPFVYLLNRCFFTITDSGGIQEEAPSLGKPVLVMRETTERPEAITAGTAILVGSSRDLIVSAAERLLRDAAAYQSMTAAGNPYGDGKSAHRIVKILATLFERQ